MWTDGQTQVWTDMKNLIVAFRNFANSPNKLEVWHFVCYLMHLDLLNDVQMLLSILEIRLLGLQSKPLANLSLL